MTAIKGRETKIQYPIWTRRLKEPGAAKLRKRGHDKINKTVTENRSIVQYRDAPSARINGNRFFPHIPRNVSLMHTRRSETRASGDNKNAAAVKASRRNKSSAKWRSWGC